MANRGSHRSGTRSFRPDRASSMLSRLSIRDVVLIDQLDLEFSPGLTILTGETGAGKSILLDALSLALGARGGGRGRGGGEGAGARGGTGGGGEDDGRPPAAWAHGRLRVRAAHR